MESKKIKPRKTGAASRPGDGERVPVISPEIDKLAYELFDRLRKEDCTVSVEDRRRFLTRAARNLLQTSGAERGIIQSTLDELPQHQREAILLHLEGLTYEQIAQRQGKDPQVTLKELANAYAKIRLQLE
jgi:DNA-directed RNA polymerase specialized sigma24 family protein